MFADTTLTVTTALEWIRDVVVIIGIAVFGWKVRDAFQGVVDFKDEVVSFMRDTRHFMHNVETNHLSHMEEYLKDLADSSKDLATSYTPPE